jgi:hypothetical protein
MIDFTLNLPKFKDIFFNFDIWKIGLQSQHLVDNRCDGFEKRHF